MARVLLDTDVLSEILKGKNAAVAAIAADYFAEHGRFTMSAVSVAEVVFGLRRVGREDRVALFEASLASAEVLPFDDAARG
jgi:tRNA(fMet)-specific endonuclease VapC